MNDDIQLDQITITRTLTTDGDTTISIQLTVGIAWLDALGMLTAAQLTLTDGLPQEDQ